MHCIESGISLKFSKETAGQRLVLKTKSKKKKKIKKTNKKQTNKRKKTKQNTKNGSSISFEILSKRLKNKKEW